MDDFAINWVKGDLIATVTFPSGTAWKGKIVKLAKQYPDEVDYVENPDGSICGHIPIKYVKIGHPKVMSDENKEKAAERMRNYQNNKKNEDDD